MKRRNWVSLGILVLFIAGCGSSSSKKEEAGFDNESTALSDGKYSDFRVAFIDGPVGDWTDFSPAKDWEESAEPDLAQILLDESLNIEIDRVIQFSSKPNGEENDIFLVWSQDLGKKEILDANFELSFVNIENNEERGRRRFLVSRNSTSNSFFIRLKREIIRHLMNQDGTMSIRAHLYLELADGSRKEVRVQFRLKGSVPLPTRVSLSINPLNGDNRHFISGTRIGRKSFTVASEQFTNNSGIPVTLWMKVSGKLSYSYEYFKDRAVESLVAGPLVVQDTIRGSIDLLPSNIEILSSDGEFTALTYSKDHNWRKYILSPRESVQISWKTMVPTRNLEIFPQPQIKKFNWFQNKECMDLTRSFKKAARKKDRFRSYYKKILARLKFSCNRTSKIELRSGFRNSHLAGTWSRQVLISAVGENPLSKLFESGKSNPNIREVFTENDTRIDYWNR